MAVVAGRTGGLIGGAFRARAAAAPRRAAGSGGRRHPTSAARLPRELVPPVRLGCNPASDDVGHATACDARGVVERRLAIAFCCVLSGCADFDVDAWAGQVEAALLPTRTPVFPRRRWLYSVEAICEAALLDSAHGLLRRAIPVWLDLLRGRPSRREAPNQLVLWAPEASDEEGEEGGVPRPGAGEDWTSYNNAQCNASARFAASRPSPRILLASIAMRPPLSLLHRLERITSVQWEAEQMQAAAIDGQMPDCALAAFHRGDLTTPVFEDARRLLWEPSVYDCLPPPARTKRNASLAFKMIARACAGAQQLVRATLAGYPYKRGGSALA